MKVWFAIYDSGCWECNGNYVHGPFPTEQTAHIYMLKQLDKWGYQSGDDWSIQELEVSGDYDSSRRIGWDVDDDDEEEDE